ncbi:MAG: enoyl-CoA hydratase-related protein [Pseudobdellovibrionaceae bacterium]
MLKIEEKNHIAYVTLNRPELRNAFNPQMIGELTQTFSKFSKRADLVAIVLRGEGKSFCAGADLTWMKSMVNFSLEENKRDSHELFQMFESIDRCALPVVGQVHGHVMGGALGLVAACDFVVAETQTQFCFSEVKLGLAPAVIGAFVLKKTTLGLVKPAMLSARIFSATEAHHMGLVHEVGSQVECDQAVHNFVSAVRDCGSEAVRETKKLISAVPDMDWSNAKIATSQVIAERRVSTEGQEGLRAFLEKRTPSWKRS